jgi:hypothetical protein
MLHLLTHFDAVPSLNHKLSLYLVIYNIENIGFMANLASLNTVMLVRADIL